MGYLSIENLNNIIKCCTSKEIDFILYLSSICNEFGNVRGLHYSDVSLKLNINNSTFYRLIDSLTMKGIITSDYSRAWGSWNITINNNIFKTKEDYKKGYIQTNKDFLFSYEFRSLDVKVKRLALALIKVDRTEKNFKISIEKLKKWVGCDSSSKVLDYIEILKKWFNVFCKDNMFYFSLKNKAQKAKNSNKENVLAHKIASICRIYNITYTLKDLNDLITLFKQYSERKLNLLRRAIFESTYTYKSIEPALINHIVSR